MTWASACTAGGLLLDLAGFWIMLWDLLPKYLHDREASRMAHGISLLSSLSLIQEPDEYRRHLGRIVEFMQDNSVPFERWHQFDRRFRRKNASRRFSEPFLRETSKLLEGRRERACTRSTQIDVSRKRAPVLTGAWLISAGFALQLVGSLL